MGARGRRDRLQRDDRPRPRPARRRRAHDLRPTTSRSPASWRSPPRPAASCAIRDAEPDDLVMIRRQFRRLGLQSMVEGSDVLVPPEQRLADPRRPRRRDPEDRRRALARLPRRPDLDRARARDPGRGHDPDLREDVREPPVLRRQAGRDGRSDHAVRSPQGDRQRSEPASRRARSRAPTSAPGWRCSSPRWPPRAPRRSATSARSTAATSSIDERLRELGAQIERVSAEPVPA